MLKLILNLIEPSDGQIYWNDTPYNAAGKINIYRRIGYVAQEPIIFRKSIKDNIIGGYKLQSENEKMYNILERSGIGSLHEKDSIWEIVNIPAHVLSGGEKKRLAYARALYKDCDILVFDEVLSSVHNEMVRKLESDFLHNDDRLVIHVTHSLSHKIATEYDGIFLVAHGKVSCIKSAQ